MAQKLHTAYVSLLTRQTLEALRFSAHFWVSSSRSLRSAVASLSVSAERVGALLLLASEPTGVLGGLMCFPPAHAWGEQAQALHRSSARKPHLQRRV